MADDDLDPAVRDTSTIPEFIRKGVNVGSVLQEWAQHKPAGPTAPGYHTIAESTPGVISVYRPEEYTAPVRNHEMEHQLQQTRDVGGIKLPGGNTIDLPGQVKPYSPEQYPAGDPRNYSYGGVQGLMQAQQQKKTAADFNQEQQADIVADYQKAQDDLLKKVQAGKATSEDLKAWQSTYDAYHPLVQQLSQVPAYSAKRSIGTMLGLGTPDAPPAPAAPGLPAADTPGLGYVQPDSNLGGVARALKP
jgi:hypothetical protein